MVGSEQDVNASPRGGKVRGLAGEEASERWSSWLVFGSCDILGAVRKLEGGMGKPGVGVGPS